MGFFLKKKTQTNINRAGIIIPWGKNGKIQCAVALPNLQYGSTHFKLGLHQMLSAFLSENRFMKTMIFQDLHMLYCSNTSGGNPSSAIHMNFFYQQHQKNNIFPFLTAPHIFSIFSSRSWRQTRCEG